MNGLWKLEDITVILRQLDKEQKPFDRYRFKWIDKELKLIGKGASALVFDAEKRSGKGNYVIKVIGFGNGRADTETFSGSCLMQKELQDISDSVVRIYDYAQYLVRIEGENTVADAETVYGYDNVIVRNDQLLLQFIVMEKLTPIIEHDVLSKPRLIPRKLAAFNDKEVMKLAYDVGMALNEAHKKGMLHRDIKPENVFYSEKTGHYKLGDFGIATRTYDGFASTCAFTKGYGAPEVVGTLDDKYDNTADIYSFGMMLFVLLNELKFPKSDGYRPNLDQYKADFEPSTPLYGNPYMTMTVLKMISYDPDHRQQSMEEVLNDLEGCMSGRRLKYRKNHMSTTLVMGIAFALVGAVTWKLSFGTGYDIRLPMIVYVLAAFCILKSLLKAAKKSVVFPNVIIFITGVIYILSTGFVWWKAVVILALLLLDHLPGIMGAMLCIIRLITALFGFLSDVPDHSTDLRWITVLLFSLALFMIWQYDVLNIRDYRIKNLVGNMNMFWGVVILFYILCIITGYRLTDTASSLFSWYSSLFGEQKAMLIRSFDLFRTGIAGIIFCIVWIWRERIMSRMKGFF